MLLVFSGARLLKQDENFDESVQAYARLRKATVGVFTRQ